jgi:competence protein ComEC
MQTVSSATSRQNVPLFHAAWQFALGIALTHAVNLQPPVLLAGVIAVAVVCAVAAWCAQRVAALPVVLLWILLGAWSALMEPQPAVSPSIHALSDGLLRQVEGTVVAAAPMRTEAEVHVNEDRGEAAPEPAAQRFPGQRIDVEVASIEVVDDQHDAPEPASGRLRLVVRWPDASQIAPFHCGDRLRASVQLLPVTDYRDPGAWSRSAYLLDQGVTTTATVKSAFVERLPGAATASWNCRLRTLQSASAERLMQLPLAMRGLPAWLRITPDDAVMLSAMVAGDRTYLTHSLRVGFERTGSFHMLVVAGFHLAIVSGCIFWMARKLRLPRVSTTLLTVGVSFGYALFTGFALPVQRAFWMVTLYLLGRMIYRERSALNALGFAALCLLVFSPRALFDASLQMTLLAVLAIAGMAAPLLSTTIHPYVRAIGKLEVLAIDSQIEPRMAQFRLLLRMIAQRISSLAGKWVGWKCMPWTVRAVLHGCEYLLATCCVEFALALPMVIYFHRVTLFALPLNLIVLPVLVVLLPLALLTLLLLALWPAAAVVPGAAAGVVLHGSVWLVRWFGALRWGDVRVATPVAWQQIFFYALLGAAVAAALGNVRWQSRRLRWASLFALLFAAFFAVLPRPVEHPPHALLMETIDVGQGDALLLITPSGKTLLVDAGGFGGGPRQAAQDFDIGEEVVAPALWARGIRHLDVVALSHAHSDHMGGMPAILRDFHPDELWVGKNPPAAAYVALLNEAAQLGVRVRAFHAGQSLDFGGEAVRVLAPMADYKPGDEPANNDSLVLRVAEGKTAVLLEGDAEAPVEEAMTQEDAIGSTLLKVGHHGSKTSTTPQFLAQVHPAWAVISCGLHNHYGHPSGQTLDRLQDAHVHTLRTDLLGAVCFALDGEQVTPEVGCGLR